MINGSTSSSAPEPYSVNISSCSASEMYPVPEQAVQYYRASTLVLTMDGYNDTSVFNWNGTDFNATSSGSVTALPALSSIEQSFLGCLNGTIGAAVPLVDGAPPSFRAGGQVSILVGLMWLVVCLMKLVL